MTPSMVGTPVRVSATGTIAKGACSLIGVLINATTAGTITLYDATSVSGTPFVNALATTAGTFVQIPAALANGLHFVEGGTLDCTFFIAG